MSFRSEFRSLFFVCLVFGSPTLLAGEDSPVVEDHVEVE